MVGLILVTGITYKNIKSNWFITLNIITNFLALLGLIERDKSWNKHPSEITEERTPVKLSEKPNSLVRVAKKEPATKTEIKYSIAASNMYITLLRFNIFSCTLLTLDFNLF